MSHKTHALNYLRNKAIADREQAKMSFELLLNNAVGIGDHSTGDFTKNLDEALDLLVDANDRIDLLTNEYPSGEDRNV